MLGLPQSIRRHLDARAIRSDILRYFEARFGPGRVRLLHMIKAVETRQVFMARLDMLPVVVKRISDGDPARRVAAIRAELLRLMPHMSDGSDQVNRCLYADAEAGIIVLSLAQGRPLRDLLHRANATERFGLIKRSGTWLTAYAKGRTRISQFAPLRVVARCADENCAQLGPADTALLLKLRAGMDEHARVIRGVKTLRGATHHDFVPRNLMVSGERFTGVDIEAQTWMPLGRNAARLLVWSAIKAPRTGPMLYGVLRADVEAIWESRLLLAQEHETTLPLFIARNLHSMLEESQGNPAATERTRAAIEAWLAGAA